MPSEEDELDFGEDTGAESPRLKRKRPDDDEDNPAGSDNSTSSSSSAKKKRKKREKREKREKRVKKSKKKKHKHEKTSKKHKSKQPDLEERDDFTTTEDMIRERIAARDRYGGRGTGAAEGRGR